MKTTLTIIMLLITSALFSQNIILNGSNWNDIDSDGLADNWDIGPFVSETQIDSGTQFVSSWNQSMLFQWVQLSNTLNHSCRCEFDLSSNLPVNFVIWWDELNGYSPLLIDSSKSLKHYTVYFIQDYPEMVKLGFTSYVGNGYIQVDNVELYDMTTVGISEPSKEFSQKPTYYTILGRELNSEPKNGIYLKRTGSLTTKILR